MKKIVTSLVLLFGLFVLVACSSQKQETSASLPQVTSSLIGKPAPDFDLQAMDGQQYKLSDLKGKKVYLKFWASWCPPCRESLPETEELAKEENKDFLVLSMISPGISGEKTLDEFPKWFQGLGYSHIPVLYDKEGQTMMAYNIQALPSAAFIDSEGIVQDFHLGAMTNKEVHETMDKLK